MIISNQKIFLILEQVKQSGQHIMNNSNHIRISASLDQQQVFSRKSQLTNNKPKEDKLSTKQNYKQFQRKKTGQIEINRQGLPNSGNLCFINVIAQMLYSASKLRQKLKDIILQKKQTDNIPFIQSLFCILKSISQGHPYQQKRNLLKKFAKLLEIQAIDQNYFKQNDSKDFLFRILENVISERSQLKDLFQVVYIETCKCDTNQKLIEERYIIDGIDQCSACKVNLNLKIKIAPQYLIIIRATRNLKSQYHFKMQTKNVMLHYKCISGVQYRGSGKYGHYTAIRMKQQQQSKLKSQNIWVYFNDDNAYQIPLEQLMEKNEFIRNIVFGIYLHVDTNYNQSQWTKNQFVKTDTELNNQSRSKKENQLDYQTNAKNRKDVEAFYSSVKKEQSNRIENMNCSNYHQIKLDQDLVFFKPYFFEIEAFFKMNEKGQYKTIKRKLYFKLLRKNKQGNLQVWLKIINYEQFIYCPNQIKLNLNNYPEGLKTKQFINQFQHYLQQLAQQKYQLLTPKQFTRQSNQHMLKEFKQQQQQQQQQLKQMNIEPEKNQTRTQIYQYLTFRHIITKQVNIQQKNYKMRINTFKTNNQMTPKRTSQLFFTIKFQQQYQDGMQQYQILIFNTKNFFYAQGIYRIKFLKNMNSLFNICQFLQQKLANQAENQYILDPNQFILKEVQAQKIIYRFPINIKYIDLTGQPN